MEQAWTLKFETGREDTSFEAFFVEHYPRVYGILYRLTGNRAEAEDLAQDVFWKFWRRPPRENTSIVGWLCRVATRTGYNALRGSRRRLHYHALAAQSSRSVSNSEWDPERSHRCARVREVLRAMKRRDAQLLVLHSAGFSYREMASALEVSPNSVGVLLNRAEEKFERLYTGGES